MNHLPTGTVTFLFTDIQDSTKLARAYPNEMPALLARHNKILDEAVKAYNGYVFRIVGDSFSVAFDNPSDAIHATLDAQRALQSEAWSPAPIKARMGIHTGPAHLKEEKDESGNADYEGYATLALTQRIMSLACGGQILISEAAAHVADGQLPEGVSLIDLGEHSLKGFPHPERIHQIAVPDLPQDFPTLTSTATIKNNIPPQLTSFVGRDKELAEARKRLTTARLLTLIGPGGTGKTRLSLQVASEELSNFKDGVWFVEFAPITDPAFVISTIASALDLREVQSIPLINLLLDYLRAKELLLILDNCEHLVEASAQAVDQILHGCPSLKLIASSREALGIDGETVYRVPSLKNDEATRLFVERATKAESRFQLTDENASFVAQICSRLDGIPLAIELAAARVKLFTPQQIAERLDDRFKLLTGGSRTALPRQQTLGALIDWSYQSLNETEQRALRRLAVFSGGWTFEAAESVIGESEAMDGLMGLVNKSLVNVEEQEGKSRYYYLETIRQYAMAKLADSGESVAARDRQLDYVLKFVEQNPQSIFSMRGPEALDETEVEHDNLRMALEWAAANHPERALKLALAIGGFWTLRDYTSEAQTWCKIILEKTESIPDMDSERARLYALLAWISVSMGLHKEAVAAAEKSLTLARQANDFEAIGRSYGHIALASVFLGDFDKSKDALKKGEEITRQHNLKDELMLILSTAAQVTYMADKDPIQSKKYLDESVRVSAEIGYHWASSFATFGTARIAAMLGDIPTARAKFNESLKTATRLGNKRIIYSSQSEFAHVLRGIGEIDEPLATYLDLLPKWRDLGHRSAVAHELECVAYLLSKKEEPVQAVTILSAADALRKLIDSNMTFPEQKEYAIELARLHEMLDEREFKESWEVGAKMSMDEAIEFALGNA